MQAQYMQQQGYPYPYATAYTNPQQQGAAGMFIYEYFKSYSIYLLHSPSSSSSSSFFPRLKIIIKFILLFFFVLYSSISYGSTECTGM